MWRESCFSFLPMKCVAFCLCGMALLGCAPRTLPDAKLAQAEGTISAAAAIGAGRNARASEHLELAKKQIDQAKALARDGETREARIVLQGAQADAELGLMIVRAAKARKDAKEAVESEGQLSSRLP
jgi:hypothetical protein